ncbi:F-actin-capping protein-like protein subunit alpha-2 [Wilcoxina mikolae CBS 423.85]|nr:F-actin-capping protein-like protein subunit alpha-2 [Wilcoxina mikolae CBS 423.85]
MSSTDAIETVSNFILDAPPGELQDVLSDVKSLIGNEDGILQELSPAIEKYNKEQLVTTKLPGSSSLVLVSEFNELGDGRFFDVESQSSFAFDHVSQKASNVQSYVFESQHSALIKSLLKPLGAHVSEHYPSHPAYGVYPTSSDSTIALLITGAKFSPSNYWNGRWRSVYTFDPSTNELSGEIKVDVHYYEDGNVRLLTTNTLEAVEIPGGSAVEVVKTIAKKEKEYQEKLNDAFGQLSEGAFKSLRRQLPITRQKIDWDKIGSYRLGQQVGLFPTHEHS